jgi:hypothetical protein
VFTVTRHDEVGDGRRVIARPADVDALHEVFSDPYRIGVYTVTSEHSDRSVRVELELGCDDRLFAQRIADVLDRPPESQA